MLKNAFFGLLVTIYGSAAVAESAAESAWQGDLVIPDGPTMAIGVELFSRPDDSRGANVAVIAQGARYLPVASLEEGDGKVAISIDSPPVRIAGPVEGGLWQARFMQGEFEAPLTLERVAVIDEPVRPDTPDTSADREVWFQSGDGVWLAGSITRPAGEGPFAAALLIGGSGATQRDAYHAGHRPMAVLAHRLAEAGIATLRYDKRGVYKSGGAHNPVDLANTEIDARAALKALGVQPGVDANQIGLIGHSEGSLIAAMLAASNDVQYVVSLAGPGMKVKDLFVLQDKTEALAAGATEEEATALSELTSRIYQTVMQRPDVEQRMILLGDVMSKASDEEKAAFEAWNGGTGTLSSNWLFRPDYPQLLATDPAEYWRSVTERALVINGGLDSQVPYQPNVNLIIAAAGGPVSDCVLPKVNHLLQPAQTASIEAYAQIETTISETLLDTVVGWVSDGHLSDACEAAYPPKPPTSEQTSRN